MSKTEFYPEWIEKYHVDTLGLSECIERWDYLYQKQKGQIYLCRPWPGITVWANKVFMETLPCETAGMRYPFVKLNYCIRGRCEVLLENGKYIYLSAGMLSIDRNQVKGMFRYPTREYEGLEIVFNLAELEKSPLTILDELGVGAGRLQDFTESDCGSFISGVSAKWDMLAKSLTGSLETAEGRIEDYRFYSLELLYLLTAGHLKPVKKAYVTSGQRRIADEAEKCICRDLQMVYTVEQLALRAGVSPSSLKKYFAMIYGCPISEYTRRKRMEYACALLKDTDQSIADIAEQAGYSHQGKFGAAFKKCIGQSPLEYRRGNRIWKQETNTGGKRQ